MKKPPQPIDWVVERMLSAGDLTVMVGDGGVGKSWKAAHIAMKVTSGEMVDGEFKTKAGTVLWFDNENGPDENDRRAWLLDRGKDFPQTRFNPYDVQFYEHYWRADEKGMDLLRALIKEVKPILIIFDSLVSILPEGKSENDAGEMRKVMDGISKTLRFDDDNNQRQQKIAGLILHHTKKDQTDYGSDDWPVFRGSGDIKNAASFLITLRKKVFEKEGKEQERIQFRWEKARRGKRLEDVYEHALIDHGDPNTNEHWIEYQPYGKVRKYEAFIADEIANRYSIMEEFTKADLAEQIKGFPLEKSQQDTLIEKLIRQKAIKLKRMGTSHKPNLFTRVGS